jgi:predicted 3-demethylubiquinone-9 3-methyltransferase (glyoxalase superfamily)
MFTGAQCGRAEAAVERYVSAFEESRIDDLRRADPDNDAHDGLVRHARFTLAGHEFMAMDSAAAHEFTFNEAVSFQVMCENQAEIDHYWGALGEGGAPGQCGWLKDEFGVSWQVVPTALPRLLGGSDADRVARVTNAFLQMKKFDIAALERAREG